MLRTPSLLVLAVATSVALPVAAASADGSSLAKRGIPLKRSAALTTLPPMITYSIANMSRSELETLDPGSGTTKKIAASTDIIEANAWSATTGRVYYSFDDSDRDAAPGGVDSVPEAGGAVAHDIAAGHHADVSQDGTTLVYEGDDGNLYKRPLATDATPVRLTGAGGFKPRFSPDGTRIVFTRAVGDNLDVFTIGTDGTGLKRITAAGNIDFSGVFSPDGKRLLFTRINDDGPLVYGVNVDGTNRRLVASDAADPDWASNGWITYLALDDRDTDQVAVLSPGVPGEESLLTNNGIDATALRFRTGQAAPSAT